MKSTEPRELLNEVIGLIRSDLSAMRNLMDSKMSETGAFSADLSRYAQALLAISKDEDQAKDSARDGYRKMTDQQLLELMEQAKATLKPKDGETK